MLSKYVSDESICEYVERKVLPNFYYEGCSSVDGKHIVEEIKKMIDFEGSLETEISFRIETSNRIETFTFKLIDNPYEYLIESIAHRTVCKIKF